MADLETGAKWWVRYFIVPIIGGGGLIAIIIALLGLRPSSQTSQPDGSKPTGSISIPTESGKSIGRQASTPQKNAPHVHALRGAEEEQRERKTDFVSTVEATRPLAYYRLQAISGNSEVGETSYSSEGGGTAISSGAPIGESGNRSVQFDGSSGWISTTQKGGLARSGSMMAWVNLASLPSSDGHYFYVAGEGQFRNDFDMQFEQDNTVRFYTAEGSHLAYPPEPSSLVHRWHMIVATADTIAHTRAIYWDGKAVVHDNDAGKPNKMSFFSIGASTQVGGRFFNGSIEEVVLWDRALLPAEVEAIFKSAGSAEPNAAR